MLHYCFLHDKKESFWGHESEDDDYDDGVDDVNGVRVEEKEASGQSDWESKMSLGKPEKQEEQEEASFGIEKNEETTMMMEKMMKMKKMTQ